MKALQLLAVASEIFPLVKTGGLADVVGALPAALAREGVKVRTLVPGYPSVTAALVGAKSVFRYDDLFGGPADIRAGAAGGLDLLVLDAPHLFDRPGNPYLAPDGKDWPDNARRFAALGRAGADIALGALPKYAPDIVHAHDWQAGLTFAYLQFSGSERQPGRVLTIHNLAFQGQFPPSAFWMLGLPTEAYRMDGVEYYGTVGYLKAGLQYADRVTTVSPSYAAEIRTPEAGMGLDGMIRARGDTLRGILNGLDTDGWDPEKDTHIAAQFGQAKLPLRSLNKTAIQTELGLELGGDAPLFGMVTRLTWQKGVDMLLDCLPTLLGLGGQLALLGSGDAALEHRFRAAAAANPGRIACVLGYDEGLAHKIMAGADAILVPSRFEPCGLTQLSALRYGAVPLVARVGGLADTVIDANPVALAQGVATGVQFAPVTTEMMRVAIERAVTLYRDPETWKKLQTNGMATDVSWHGPARAYAAMFRELRSA
ncbi:MAG TPA: glycogen synthase GlgA [Alphaproteobacteria bacterium]|jgi:starch synthase|nr:glycogen synthase GlgA [Alphaproteobacteria bacterium]